MVLASVLREGGAREVTRLISRCGEVRSRGREPAREFERGFPCGIDADGLEASLIINNYWWHMKTYSVINVPA